MPTIPDRFRPGAHTKRAGWVVVDRAVSGVVSFLALALAARELTVDEFSDLALGIAMIGLLIPVLALGLAGTIVDQVARRPADATGWVLASFRLRAAAAVAVVLAAAATMAFTGAPDVVATLGWPAYAAPVVLATTSSFQYFEGLKRNRTLAVLRTLGSMVALALTVAGSVRNESTAWFFAAILSQYAVAGVIGLAMIVHERSGASISFDRAVALARRSWPLLISSVAVVLNLRVDQFMLAVLSDPEELARYAIAANVAEATAFIPAAIATAYAPTLSATFAEERSAYAGLAQSMYRTLGTVCVALALGVAVSSIVVVPLLFGATYDDAVPLVFLLVIGGVWQGVRQGSSKELIATGQLQGSLYSHGLAAVVNIAANAALIPVIGATGAAIATVTSYFLAGFSLIFWSRTRSIGVRFATVGRR